MRLDVYSDPICPWCYIGQAHMRVALTQLAEDGLRFQVDWRPFQLNPDMPAGGLPRRAYRVQKFGSIERSDALDAQVSQAAAVAGITMRFDLMQRTPNTMDAHRLLQHAGTQQDALKTRLFQDYFEHGQDIGDHDVLLDAAESVGLDRAATASFLESDAGRAEIAAADALVRRAGLDGVPAFALEDHLVFAGAVGPDQFATGLARAVRVLQTRDRQPAS